MLGASRNMMADKNPSTASPLPTGVSGSDGSYISQLTENPFFNAGFGLMGITVGLGLLKSSWKHAAVLARRQLFVTLEIPSKDKAYHWVLQWITANAAKQSRHLSVGK